MTSRAGRILGNYELGEPIGRGGASDVFAGVHRFLGHEVAVKLLRADLPGDPRSTAVEAFLGEAARARAVRHPNLVSVLDFGRDEVTGRCYLVMERIPGESLAERLRRVGRLAERDVRALGAALADAMQAAHDGGIVHRDLKPANIMLRGDQPTVVDFGLARDLGGQSALETGRRVGTPAYMAPEQLTGGLIAPCVDIWSLGVILFEAVTGALPFEGFADGRCPQLFETAPRVALRVQVTPELDALVAACLERSPGRRPASMAAVGRALRGEGEERVTQDVSAPLLGGLARGSSEVPEIDVQVDDDDEPDRVERRTGRVGAASARGRQDRGRRAARRRRGRSLLRPRHWLLVALAAVAAALAAAVTVRAVGTPPPDAAPPVAPAEEARAPAEEIARPLRRARGVPSPTAAMEQAIAASRAGASRRAAPEKASVAAGAPGEAGAPGPGGSPDQGAAPTPAVSPDQGAAPSPAVSGGAAAASLAIDIRSTPSGADVLVAGKRRGRTPLRLELPGPGRVLLRKRGYRPAAVHVERAGLLDVHLTRRGNGRPAAERDAKKKPRGEGLD